MRGAASGFGVLVQVFWVWGAALGSSLLDFWVLVQVFWFWGAAFGFGVRVKVFRCLGCCLGFWGDGQSLLVSGGRFKSSGVGMLFLALGWWSTSSGVWVLLLVLR